MRRNALFITCLLGACLLGLGPAAILRGETIRFNRDIRPILSKNCFQCHGPDRNARQANLRLDHRDEAVAAGAIVPGDARSSKVVARVFSPDPVKVMPPAYADLTLSGPEKDLLRRWIEQGAEYEQHWAYLAPERPGAPDDTGSDGAAGIDHLVARKLEAMGLAPVGEADRATLIRRLSFDLTGLPPSAGDVRAFARDHSPEAYEKQVDRLLASPHFGERMAVHWLDLVRYADTVGCHSDVPINVYPFRDYVIRSFNKNKPFDQFTREQLAGDLLADPSEEQLVASAYNRLNRMTNEGGAQPKEYLAKYASDRVLNFSNVWLGSTLGCAECHDHKFDPFHTKDFYQMAAFFADIEEQGVYRGRGGFGPSIHLLPEKAKRETASIESRLAALRKKGAGKLQASGKQIRKFRDYLRRDLERWRVLEPVRVWNDCEHPDIDGCERLDLRLEEDGFVRETRQGEKEPNEAVQKVEIPLPGGRVTALLFEAFATEEFKEFSLSEFEAELLTAAGRRVPIAFGALLADHEEDESLLRFTTDGNHHTGWGGKFETETSRRAVWIFDKPLDTTAGERLRVTMIYNGRPAKRILGRFRLSVTDSDFPELPPAGGLREAILAAGRPAGDARKVLETAFTEVTEHHPRWKQIRPLERRRKTLLDNRDECLVAKAVGAPRVVRVLARGNWMDESGEIVSPQVPHFLNPIAASDRRLTRLDLAEWLVSGENPLTARVFMNRVWKMLFGTGLSKVLNDIGSQGETPVNPELLDWLAVEFAASGWDVKHMLRTIVLSDTYRRSSAPTGELRKRDPYNRYLGRQAMLRIDAEFVRDNALAVSGLLNRTLGGKSVRPYQPAGYYKELNFPKRVYEPNLGADQFRRGLYTHWQRSFLHPSLMAFDAPSRENCTAERSVSNTPLQSLVLLNDPTYVEAARAFAGRILRSGPKETGGRIDFAFEEAFARRASSDEKEILSRLAASRVRYFQDHPDEARQLLSVGIVKATTGVNAEELAAWTSVARAIFNKHEFVMRY